MAPRAASKRAASKRDEEEGGSTGADGPTTKPKPSASKPPARKTAPAKKPAGRSAAKAKSDSEAESGSDSGSPSPATSSGPEPSSEEEDAPKPVVKRARRAGGFSAATAAGAGGGTSAVARARKGAAGKAADAAGAKDAAGGDELSGRRYFLMKSEPEEFSFDDLAAKKEQTSHWEGVRNAQARNIMKSMKLGDEAFFYHSSCKVPAVVGVVKVVREAYPDHFAFDKSSKYYDPRSTPDAPKWWMVDVQLVRRMKRPVTLAELRGEGAGGAPIKDMVLINKSRLSVQPVTPEQWARILEMEAQGAEEGTN